MKITIAGIIALALASAGCATRVFTKPSGFQTADKDHFYIIEDVQGESSKILKCTINADNSVNCVAQVK